MHSFHQSRGRILFEALCALGISASLTGAWLQTDASALLPAAAISLIYALVRMSDMVRGAPADTAVVAEDHPSDVPTPWDLDEAPVSEVVEQVEPAKPAAAKSKTKRPRKTTAPRQKFAREVPDAEEPVTVESAAPEPVEQRVTVESAAPEPVEEEMTSIPLEPLFEPQPFVRQQHAVFGRKARFG